MPTETPTPPSRAAAPPARLRRSRGRFPVYRQRDEMDCGPTCLRMIARYHGRDWSLAALREKSFITRSGVSLLGLSEAAEAIGLRSLAARIPFAKLDQVPLPCIVHWRQNHFVVVHRITRDRVYVADPAAGRLVYRRADFLSGWSAASGSALGVVLALEPAPEFFRRPGDPAPDRASWRFVLGYLGRHRGLLLQLAAAFLVGTVLSLIAPFLTQALVDVGIANRDVRFVYTLLLAQVTLFAGRLSVQFLRSWILLHVGVRLNVSIISDFLAKLLKLPMRFFDGRRIGDLLQRIQDHNRIERFLTATSLEVLFSAVSVAVYGAVLFLYQPVLLLVFAAGGALSAAWVLAFMRRRRQLDYQRFGEMADEQGSLIQLVQGMQEIKLNNAERPIRWEWERIQARLYRTRVSGLALGQLQEGGLSAIHELKNILITFLSALAVMEGSMTLGMMMAVQFIVGQLNAPLAQLVGFVQAYQDARISLERLGEVHAHEDEAPGAGVPPEGAAIRLHGVSFRYDGPRSEPVLDDVTLDLPAGGVTAIVGVSGSGKSTLLKLLLKFHPPTRGEIRLGDVRLADVDTRRWRRRCGAVMQGGHIFNDTIARNIAVGAERPGRRRLREAARVACIDGFVESLPLGYDTRIGSDGLGLSEGQKQRLLIARAVYRNPRYLFFDEATSALDALNERAIMERLAEYSAGRTVVVIAHRLSTVRRADQIVVLDGGRVVERGTHEELAARRGAYYDLVRNQLELGR